MRNKSWLILCAGIFLIVANTGWNPAMAENPISVEIPPGKAKVNFIEGKAYLINEKAAILRELKIADLLSPKDNVRTAKGAKIELKLPDGSFVRFHEQTTFTLVEMSMNKKKQHRSIRIHLKMGDIWSKVSKIFSKSDRFEVKTRTAVAGIRGTVFRIQIQSDDTVNLKVYWGEILVRKAQEQSRKPFGGPLEKPVKVSGPQPVAGPHPVSVEEWTYIVKSMQQITIKPDGEVTKPFPFSQSEDMSDWVRWNQARDKTLDW